LSVYDQNNSKGYGWFYGRRNWKEALVMFLTVGRQKYKRRDNLLCMLLFAGRKESDLDRQHLVEFGQYQL